MQFLYPDSGGAADPAGEGGGAIAWAETDVSRDGARLMMVGQMATEVAHDFNNRIQVIAGALHMMEGEAADVPHLIRMSLESVDEAVALTRRLLDFARPRPQMAEPVDVNRLVEGMTNLLACTLGAGVRLELILAEQLAHVICDAHQLENALLNVAINARDAMAAGGRLTIETCPARVNKPAYGAPWGDYAAISVRDTGAGMSEYVLNRAFDPFFSTKAAGVGTGLGLSSIKHFIDAHRGHIHVWSEPGAGTCVTLFLPCDRTRTWTGTAAP